MFEENKKRHGKVSGTWLTYPKRPLSILTNPAEIADALNTFYVNIGKSVEQNIPKGKTPFSNYLRKRNIFNITLNPCTDEEVGKYISDLSSISKSTWPNSFRTSILKYNIDQPIDQITTILNKSLADGTFPDLLKLAINAPIIDQFLSKIFEKQCTCSKI